MVKLSGLGDEGGQSSLVGLSINNPWHPVMETFAHLDLHDFKSHMDMSSCTRVTLSYLQLAPLHARALHQVRLQSHTCRCDPLPLALHLTRISLPNTCATKSPHLKAELIQLPDQTTLCTGRPSLARACWPALSLHRQRPHSVPSGPQGPCQALGSWR